MAIPGSGTVTLAMLQTEFGGANPIGLNEYYRGGTYVPNTGTNAAVPTSGAISLSNFYGAAAASPCTVNIDWGYVSGTGVNITAPTRTITVPSGNSGQLRLNVTNNTGGNQQYSKAAGAYTTFTNGTIITLTNGQTLAFRTNTGSVGVDTTDVQDVDTSAYVGTSDRERT